MPFGKINPEHFNLIDERSSPSDYDCISSDCTDPEDLPEYATYAYTINVFTGKRLGAKTWKDTSPDRQKEILLDIVNNAVKTFDLKQNDYRFEKTKAGHYHLHGMFVASDDIATSFQSVIHKKLGLPQAKPDRVCMVVRTLFSPRSWVKYMTKEDAIL